MIDFFISSLAALRVKTFTFLIRENGVMLKAIRHMEYDIMYVNDLVHFWMGKGHVQFKRILNFFTLAYFTSFSRFFKTNSGIGVMRFLKIWSFLFIPVNRKPQYKIHGMMCEVHSGMLAR